VNGDESSAITASARANPHARELWLRATDVLGPAFNTGPFALFLYGLARMQRPQIVLELGTGFGVTSFWLAQAIRENGSGHVYTIDDGRATTGERFSNAMRELVSAGVLDEAPATAAAYFEAMIARLDCASVVTQLTRTIDLTASDPFTLLPFADRSLDLVFSDFSHGPDTVLLLLAHLLPRLSAGGSIFIDSASTYWPSYLLLEHLATLLNRGEVPEALRALRPDIDRYLQRRRLTLVHLTKQDDSAQNGVAWLKLDPIDLVPYPTTTMRQGPPALR
jgi:predicted O-methyltransferase YrrM